MTISNCVLHDSSYPPLSFPPSPLTPSSLSPSIGSLGINGRVACVSNVTISNCVLTNLTNGLRIKTYVGGNGAVYNINYENILMKNVRIPIVINQVGFWLAG